MSKITIIRPDNIVVVDGIGLAVDCSPLDPSIRVVQWDGTAGHVEYSRAANGDFVPNEEIGSIAPYQSIIDGWTAAKAAADAAKAEMEAAAAEAAKPPQRTVSNPRYGDWARTTVLFDIDGKTVAVPTNSNFVPQLLSEAGVTAVPAIIYSAAAWLDVQQSRLSLHINGTPTVVADEGPLAQVVSDLSAANVTITAYQPVASDVQVERERRLALGFTYDFGDARGVHHFATTDADMKNWGEVTDAALAQNALGDATPIDILTETGPTQVTPLEWFAVLNKAKQVRQPLFAASFNLMAMNPIPSNYTADAYWPAT